MNAIELLLNRQSNPALCAPYPHDKDLDNILQAGMRVPDHGCISPWHFKIIKDDGLQKLSDIFVDAVTDQNVDEARLTKTSKMPFRAPMIIVISTNFQTHDKVPEQEQVVAAGCAAHAMQMASYALGYGAMWRTGELSNNKKVKEALDVTGENQIIGFLYIGTESKTIPNKKAKPYQDHVSYL